MFSVRKMSRVSVGLTGMATTVTRVSKPLASVCRERNASLNSSRMVILGQSAQLASVTPPLAASSGRPARSARRS